jgi:hypothetical protein
MIAAELLAADRAQRVHDIAVLEGYRLRALCLGPAGTEVLAAIEHELAVERRELEAHE